MVAVHRCHDYAEMSRRAADSVLAAVAGKPDSLLCLATGHSPAALYVALAREARAKPGFFQNLRIIKLDEWLGVPASDPGSCEHYLRSRVLEPLAIDAARYLAFDGAAAEPLKECVRVNRALIRQGPIDLCILGLGKNGHLGLNEPGASLMPHCHVATLTEQTRQHSMVGEREDKPVRGMTLGMRDILDSRKILLLVTGQGKEAAAAKFFERAETPELPATFLWSHPDVEIWLDESTVSLGPQPD